MKKFHFALDNLLSYKNQILDNELKILSDLNRQHQEAIGKLSNIQQNYEKCKAGLDQKLVKAASPQECQLYMYYIVDLNDQTKIVQHEIEKISMRIVEQISQVREMKIETRTLESLRETKLDEYNKAAIKRTELEMDEFMAGASLRKA